jgi:hypothetical protein
LANAPIDVPAKQASSPKKVAASLEEHPPVLSLRKVNARYFGGVRFGLVYSQNLRRAGGIRRMCIRCFVWPRSIMKPSQTSEHLAFQQDDNSARSITRAE